METISRCGLICAQCSYYEKQCSGCAACQGKPFYTDTVCPIDACAKEHGYETCYSCKQLVCDIWQNTRDPRLDDEAFAKDIQTRLDNLKRYAKKR